MPKVLNKNKDFIPAEAVYCGRGSPWGNPYRMGAQATPEQKKRRYDDYHGKNGIIRSRDEACDLFKKNILPTLDVSNLKGKDLVCYCAPLRCHCDDILIKANEL